MTYQSLFFIMLVLHLSNLEARVYKCIDKDGNVGFTNTQCPSLTKSEQILNIQESFPPPVIRNIKNKNHQDKYKLNPANGRPHNDLSNLQDKIRRQEYEYRIQEMEMKKQQEEIENKLRQARFDMQRKENEMIIKGNEMRRMQNDIRRQNNQNQINQFLRNR